MKSLVKISAALLLGTTLPLLAQDLLSTDVLDSWPTAQVDPRFCAKADVVFASMEHLGFEVATPDIVLGDNTSNEIVHLDFREDGEWLMVVVNFVEDIACYIDHGSGYAVLEDAI